MSTTGSKPEGCAGYDGVPISWVRGGEPNARALPRPAKVERRCLVCRACDSPCVVSVNDMTVNAAYGAKAYSDSHQTRKTGENHGTNAHPHHADDDRSGRRVRSTPAQEARGLQRRDRR